MRGPGEAADLEIGGGPVWGLARSAPDSRMGFLRTRRVAPKVVAYSRGRPRWP